MSNARDRLCQHGWDAEVGDRTPCPNCRLDRIEDEVASLTQSVACAAGFTPSLQELRVLTVELRALGVLHYKTPGVELVLGPPPPPPDTTRDEPVSDDTDPDDGLWDASGLRPDLSRMGR